MNTGIVILLAPYAVSIFSEDAATLAFAAGFLRALCLVAPLLTFYRVISGHLTGAGDTAGTGDYGNFCGTVCGLRFMASDKF
nr:MATE family efflux transporter [Halarsenatibacter silvermanii]